MEVSRSRSIAFVSSIRRVSIVAFGGLLDIGSEDYNTRPFGIY
jgi:hypothetical protein